MPVARFQLADGRVARFEIPEGTTPEQAQAFIDGYEFPTAPAEEPAEEPGLLGELGRGVVRGTGTMISGLSRPLKELTPDAWAETIDPAADFLKEAGTDISESVAPRATPDLYEAWDKGGVSGALKSLAVTVSEGSAPMLGGALVGVLTKNPTAAMAVMGLTSAPQEYTGIREMQDQTGQDSIGAALAGTAVVTALDIFTGAGKAVSNLSRDAVKELFEQGLRSATKEVLKTGASESGTEALQTVIEQVAGGADPTTKQSLLDTLEAGLAGTVGGTFFGGVSEATNKLAAARSRSVARGLPALSTMDVMVPDTDTTSTLDIISKPDAEGHVVVRSPEGNIRRVSLAELSRMRVAPTEEEEAVTPAGSAQAGAEAAMDLNSQAEQQAQQAQQLQEQQDRSKTLYDSAVELLPTLGEAVSAKSLHEALKTSVGPEVKYNEVLPILGQLATNGRIGEPDKKTMKRPVLVSAAQGSLDLNQVAPTVAPGLEKVIPENAELQGAVDAKAGLPPGTETATQQATAPVEQSAPLVINDTRGSEAYNKAVAAYAGNGKPLATAAGEVRLVRTKDTYDEMSIEAVSPEGKIVGRLFYNEEEGFNPDVWVDGAWRRQGVASAMYDLAESTGGKIPPVDSKQQNRTVEGAAFRQGRDAKKNPTFDPADTTTPATEAGTQQAPAGGATTTIEQIQAGKTVKDRVSLANVALGNHLTTNAPTYSHVDPGVMTAATNMAAQRVANKKLKNDVDPVATLNKVLTEQGVSITQGELDLGPSRFTLPPAASPTPTASPVGDPSTQGELDFSQTEEPIVSTAAKEPPPVIDEAPTSDSFNIPAGADMTVTPNVGDMEAALSDIGNLQNLHNTFVSTVPNLPSQEAPALVKTGMLPAIQKTIASVKTALKSQPYAARVAEETEEQAAASAADQEASPVGNNIQWALRDAQRAAGRGNFQEALEHLEALEDIATREDYAAEAAKNDPKLVENTFAPAPHETRSPAFFSRAVGVVREAGKVNVTGLAQSLGVPVRAARDLVARMEAAGVVKKRTKGWVVTPPKTVGAPAKGRGVSSRIFKTVAEADRAQADRRVAEEQAKGVAERDAALGPTVYNRGETKTTLMERVAGATRRDVLRGGVAAMLLGASDAVRAATLPRTTVKGNTKIQEALRSGSLQKVIEAIRDTSKNPAYREIARLMALGGMGGTTIAVSDFGRQALSVVGRTSTTTGNITIHKTTNGISGDTEETILHEALHSFLNRRYNSLNDYLAGNRAEVGMSPQKADAFIERFQSMFMDFRNMMQSKHVELLESTNDETIWASEAANSPDELFVRVLSDPNLIAFLKTIDIEGNTITKPGQKSWWSKILDFLADLLGITREPTRTALDQLLDSATNVLRAAALDKPTGEYARKLNALDSAQERVRYERVSGAQNAPNVSARTAGLMASSNLAAVTTLDKIKSIRSFKDAYELAATLWSGLDMDGKKLLLQALPTRDILRLIKKYTPAIVYDEAAALNRKVQALNVERGRLMKVGRKTAERWEQYDSLGTAAQQALWNAMNFSTLYSADPSTAPNAAAFLAKEQAASGVIGHKPGRMDEVKDVYEFWNEAGKYGKGVYNGHAIYKEVRDSYIATLDAQERLLKAIINGSAASDKQTMMTSLQAKFQEVRKIAPYFPLSRDGQYGFIHGKGDDRVVVLRETVAARNIAMADYAKSKGTSTRDMIANDGLKVINNAGEKKKQLTEAPGLLKDILAHLDKSGGTLDAAAVKKMKEDVYEMFLLTLPDADLRKKFLPRKGTGGFNPDARRAFLKHVHASSYQLARLEYSGEVRNAISQMKGTLKGNPDQSQIEPFLDRMEARARAEIEPKSQDDYSFLDKVADVGTQASFFMMLTSMKTALINFTQLPIVGANVLGGRFGYGKTTAMMAKYLKLSNTFGVSERVATPLGATENQFRMPSVEYSKMMQTPRMRAAFEAGVAQDIFEKTYLMDLAGGRSTPSGTESSALTKGFRVGMNVITGGLHHVERISREIMYMSTYELSYNENIAKGMSAKDAQAAAIEDAIELTTEAMFDYSQSNKPEIMRNPVGRLAFQFMTFPMQMISLLVRNAHGSFATLPPSEKKRARSVFFGVLGMTFMFAGMSGMPGMGLVLGMLDGLRDVFRGDDEDDDDELDPLSDNSLEYWLREVWIPQTFGPESSIAKSLGLSGAVSKLVEQSLISGPVSALTGADFSGSVGLDNLIYHSDQSGNTNKEDYYQGLVGALFGPTGALGAQIASAMDDFGNDDTARGMEKLFPAFFKGLVRATRLASEGNLTRTGAEIKSAEYYTTGKLALQVIGFGDTEVNQIQKANSLAKSVQAEDAQKKSSLLNRMDKLLSKYKRAQTPEAKASIDADIDAVYDDIEQYNRRSPDPITGEDIRMSQDAREQARDRAVYGLVLPKPFARYLRDRQ